MKKSVQNGFGVLTKGDRKISFSRAHRRAQDDSEKTTLIQFNNILGGWTMTFNRYRKAVLIFLVGLVLGMGAINGVSAQVLDTLWIETWESETWNSRWHVDYGTWEVGTPSVVGPSTAHEGAKCAATILGDNYADGQSTRLIRHSTFVVPEASANPRLRFWHWFNLNLGDRGYVQVREAGSADWVTLSGGIYGQDGDAGYGHYYSSSHWTRPKLDLSAYAGKTVELCFYFYSSTVSGDHVAPGWYIDEVLVETGEYVYNDPEDWESGFDDWYADYGTWEVGAPTFGPSAAYEGTQCAGTILDGNYFDRVASRLISPAFVVPSASANPRLRFWHWYSFNLGDQGQVQVRVVGDTLWATLISAIYTGNSGGVWTYPYLPLTDYSGDTIELCYYFASSTSSGDHVSSGWYVDSIAIEADCPQIACPEGVIDSLLCEVPGTVYVNLPIDDYLEVEVTSPQDGTYPTWAGDVLTFTAGAFGTYNFTVIATNAACADTCVLSVNVSKFNAAPKHITILTKDTSTVAPSPKYIDIASACGAGVVEWKAEIMNGEEYIDISPTTGTNPDSIAVSLSHLGLTPGIYSALVLITDVSGVNPSQTINVSIFVESGVDVGDYYVNEKGKSFAIPINLYAEDTIKGFTIPLKLNTAQSYYVKLDSVITTSIVKTLLLDTTNGWIICERPIQEPPLPDSSEAYSLGYAYFTVKEGAAPGTDSITTGLIAGYEEYAYKFIDKNGVDFVPKFNPGYIFIDALPLPVQIVLNLPEDFGGWDGVKDTTTLTFNWNEMSEVVQYEFNIGTSTDFNLIAYSRITSVTVISLKAVEVDYPADDFWRVKGRNAYGWGEWSVPRSFGLSTDVAEIANDNLPKEFALGSNYPNPFNPSTTIGFSLPQRSQVDLEIFNILGQKVTILHEGELAAGTYQATWDGTDGKGNNVSTGIYFYRLKAGEFNQTRKMLLLK